jgi:hypothetical protein
VYLLSRLKGSARLEAVKSRTALALVSECAVTRYRIAVFGLIFALHVQIGTMLFPQAA